MLLLAGSAAISANSESLKNLSTIGLCVRRRLQLGLPKFDIFLVVMRTICLLKQLLRGTVSESILVLIGANEKSHLSDVK